MTRRDTAKGKSFGCEKWMDFIRLRSTLTRAQGDPLFRISLSYSAVIIYLIQYVVCQGKCRVNMRLPSHCLVSLSTNAFSKRQMFGQSKGTHLVKAFDLSRIWLENNHRKNRYHDQGVSQLLQRKKMSISALVGRFKLKIIFDPCKQPAGGSTSIRGSLMRASSSASHLYSLLQDLHDAM